MVSLPVIRDDNLPHGADFAAALERHGLAALRGAAVTTVQVNLGKRCNQACRHCHVDAGPARTEVMTADTAARIMSLLDASPAVEVVDITGGAPELNPCFRPLVEHARARGKRVIDRCNLTVLFEPAQEDTAEFLASRGVDVTASLPCYSRDNVDEQRGGGVFEKSLRALRLLNRLGYGRRDSGLRLDLVYNPVGAFLPPPQDALERDYKRRLQEDHGVVFNRLFTITNMPISRFAHALERDGTGPAYMALLSASFNPATVDGLMCRGHISVGHDGSLYDCDFNQMLAIPAAAPGPDGRRRGPTIWDIASFAELHQRAIATASHCFGCTAGAGSSCGGALEPADAAGTPQSSAGAGAREASS